MSYVFEPDAIKAVVVQALQEPGSVEDLIVRIQTGLAQRYPGKIGVSGEWYFTSAGGGTQQLTILYASLTEYVTIVGIPTPTSGFSGRYRTEIYDFVFDGALENYAAGQLRTTVYEAGDVSRFTAGEARNWCVRDRLFMVEYTRGPIPGMLALPLADTIFGTLDYVSFARLVWGFTSALFGPCCGGVWHNWMGNLTCKPALVFRPSTKEQLSAIVKQAWKTGRKVRLFGTKHSWTPLVPTDDYLVDTSLLTRWLEPDPSQPDTVRVETGMSIGDLTVGAAKRGLVIDSPTVATQFSVGGVVATASHGTGFLKKKHPGATGAPPPETVEITFPDRAVSFTVVKYDGTIAEVKADDDDINAMRCSLGALGIIYAVTLKGRPYTNFRVENTVMPLDEALQKLPEVVKDHEGVEMFWFPYTPNATFRTIDKTHEPVTYGPLQKALTVLEQLLFEGILANLGLPIITKLAPSITPLFTRIAASFMGPGAWVMSPVDAYHYQYFYPLVWDSEFAVPLAKAPDAFGAYVDLVNQLRQEQGIYPVNMVVHARFTSGDATWISPDYGRDSCYIESVTAKGTPHVQELYKLAEAMLMDKFEGRPHWAKMWYDMDRVRACYEAGLRRFEPVRAKWDPDGVFLNDFLARLMAPFPGTAGG